MFFKILILLTLLNIVLSQQGIFDPYTFNEGQCTGDYKWTTWFDTNDPNMTQGEFEITRHIKENFPDFMCASPKAIEGQTAFDENPSTTGDAFRITIKDGFLCLNQQIVNYKSKMCQDYKVRYCCPASALTAQVQ
ncbi:unnamed protein product [Rotaria sp. Silwood1]|nr:unnamed protein product [Rotaria sp. Silwood1]CAF1669044.1 unnamed protein product [Rotaria sp. Silwood1]